MNLKVATWNLSCGMDINRELAPGDYFYDAIKFHDLDILFLQEVIIRTIHSAVTAEKISRNTELKYFLEHELSPSHKLSESFMGIAILSKYPLKQYDFLKLPNPGFKIEKNGRVYEAHEKGFMFACIEEFDLLLGVGHCPSFNFFDVDDRKYKELIYRPVEEKMMELLEKEKRIIIGGDFNTKHITAVMPQANKSYKQLIHGETRPRLLFPANVQSDYIFISDKLVSLKTSIIEGIIDHYICIAEVTGKE